MFHRSLTSHFDFYKGYWYKSKTSKWYFFYETEREYSINTSEKFYSTLDDELVPIVELLHSKNIITTPSCAGHNYSEKYYRELYKEICHSVEQIKSRGLELVNIENDTTIIYRDDSFFFPYSETTFVRFMLEYGKVGVLGLLGDFSYIKDTHNLKVNYDGVVTNFLVEGNNDYVWAHLYSEFTHIPKH